MMKIMKAAEKTNSYRPSPWQYTLDPFAAWRGAGARHRGFLAVARDYAPRLEVPLPWQGHGYWKTHTAGEGLPDVFADVSPTKVIKTAKGGLLLVPAAAGDDEKIGLVTLSGGFRGDYSRVKGIGADILDHRFSNVHCCPTAHLIVRFTQPAGYLLTETGRRCSTGDVELFSWAGIRRMPTEEYESWVASGSPAFTDPVQDDSPAPGQQVVDCECGRRVAWGRSFQHNDKWRCIDCHARAVGAHKGV